MKKQKLAKKANWDRPYKVIFSNPEIVKDLIISHYNSDWVADVDFSTLKNSPLSTLVTSLTKPETMLSGRLI